MPSLTTASLLTEEVTELGHSSRPSSPWSSLSGVLRSPRSRTTSGGYASKIPVLAGQQTLQYQSFRHYLDVDDEDEEPYVEQTAPLRFADPPPTLKELHADGHKITQGTHEDSGLGDDADVWDQYCSEAKEYDEELMNELNGSLDVLLIFVEYLVHSLVSTKSGTGRIVLRCSSGSDYRVVQDATTRPSGPNLISTSSNT